MSEATKRLEDAAREHKDALEVAAAKTSSVLVELNRARDQEDTWLQELTRMNSYMSGMAQFLLLLVRIRDTGPGVPEEHRHRIFDPFYTTKAPGVGTGLGLSISHSIVTKLGGTIECEPREPGQGAEFKLRIPLPGHVLSEDTLEVYAQSGM